MLDTRHNICYKGGYMLEESKVSIKSGGDGETKLSRSIKAKISDKRAFQTIVQLLGDLESDKGMEVMSKGGVPMPGGGVKVTQIMAAVQAQYNKARDGDTAAAVFIRDSGWGKPSADEAPVSGGAKMAIATDVMKLLQERAQAALGDGGASSESSVRQKDYVEIEVDENGLPKMVGEASGGKNGEEA